MSTPLTTGGADAGENLPAAQQGSAPTTGAPALRSTFDDDEDYDYEPEERCPICGERDLDMGLCPCRRCGYAFWIHGDPDKLLAAMRKNSHAAEITRRKHADRRRSVSRKQARQDKVRRLM